MKYNLTLNLKAFYEIMPKADIKDAYILDYLIWICASKAEGVVKKRVVKGGKELTWVNYTHLLNELPLLKIKDKAALSRRIDELRERSLIDTYFSKEDGNRKYIRLKPLVDKLFSSTIASKQHGIASEQQGYCLKATYNSTSNNNTRIIKEKEKINKKEKEIIDYYLQLKGIKYTDTDHLAGEKLKIKYEQYEQTAEDLLVLGDNNIGKIKGKIIAVKGWAEIKNLEWTLGTVVNRFESDNTVSEKPKFKNKVTGKEYNTGEELSASYKDLDQSKRSTKRLEKI